MMRGAILFCLASCAVLFSACRTEHALVDQTSYTREERDPQAQLLKGIDILTLRKAQEIALKNNPGFRSAFYSVNAARMRYYQALGAYSPVISAAFSVGDQLTRNNGSSDYPVKDEAFYTYTAVQASWTVFDGLVREFRYLGAKRTLKMQEYLEENAKRLLIRGVAYAYNDILLAKAQMRIADADLAFQEKMYREAVLKQRAGTAPRSETLNFKGKANQARENRINAEYQYELGIYALAVLMGYTAGTIPAPIAFPEPVEVPHREQRPVEVFLDMALANRPDLRAYRERLRISEYQLFQRYGSFLPFVSVFAGYSYSSNSTQISGSNPAGFGNFSLEGNAFNYGLSAGWILFNGGIRYNQLREAREQLEIAKLTGEEVWLNVVHEVRSAYSNYAHCMQIVQVSKENLDIMTEQRDLVEKEYIAGEIEVTRLNEAQTNLVRSSSSYADALIKLRKAQEQLNAAANL